MSSKKNICHISTVHPPFDTRVFHKECVFLQEKGYETYLMVTADFEQIVRGIHILPLPEAGNRFIRIFRNTFIALFKAIRLKADLYHFHDPELMLVGIILRIFGQKVVYDVHEDVPVQILAKKWLGPLHIRRLVSYVIKILERSCALCFNAVVAATDTIAANFPKRNMIILKNYSDIVLIDSAKSVLKKTDSRIIIYVGCLTRERGINELISAMKHVDNGAELWLLGRWKNEQFKKECLNNTDKNRIKYLGYKPLLEVYSYMKAADVAVTVLHPISNYLNSLPVKTFEYMACSLPIVMSNFPDWQENFSANSLFVNPYEPIEIAGAINKLLGDRVLRGSLGKAGRQMIEQQYSWQSESKKLADLYRILLFAS